MQWKVLALFVALASSFVSAAPKPYGVGRSESNERPGWYQEMIEAQNGNQTATNAFIQRYKKRDGLYQNYQATSVVTDYTQYQLLAQLSQAAYCKIEIGEMVGDTQVVWSMGDGGKIPHTFVGYSPTLGIVVSHEGSNLVTAESIQNDADAGLTYMDRRLSFMGCQSQVHKGFQETWLRTADVILSQVQSLVNKYPDTSIFTTGHSLGASLSLLDSLYLQNEFPWNHVSSVVFGLPRTGNQHFANSVDKSHIPFTHIVNGNDPVPHSPAATKGGYQQVSGEIWIHPANSNHAVSCPGQENMHCSDSVMPILFSPLDHTGIYFDVWIAGRGNKNCPAKIGR